MMPISKTARVALGSPPEPDRTGSDLPDRTVHPSSVSVAITVFAGTAERLDGRRGRTSSARRAARRTSRERGTPTSGSMLDPRARRPATTPTPSARPRRGDVRIVMVILPRARRLRGARHLERGAGLGGDVLESYAEPIVDHGSLLTGAAEGDHPASDRVDGGLATPHHLCRLRIGQVLVEAEHDRRALPDRQRHQRGSEIDTVGRIRRLHLDRSGTALQVPGFDRLPPAMGPHEVHDRGPQVRMEAVRGAEVQHPTGQANERVLHEIFGEPRVPGQQVREPERLGRVACR